MSTGLEPLPPYPVFSRAKKESHPALIITLIIVAVLVFLTCLIIYAVFRNRAGVVISRCEPGLCVVTISSGEKICPATTSDQLTYNPAFQDCTSANYCQSSRVPCSVLTGGTLNCNGVCGVGNNQCNCLPSPTV